MSNTGTYILTFIVVYLIVILSYWGGCLMERLERKTDLSQFVLVMIMTSAVVAIFLIVLFVASSIF